MELGRLLLPLLPLPLAEHVAKGIRAVAAIAIAAITAAAFRIALGVFDLLVGGVDLLHLPGGLLIAGVGVRVIFLCQAAVGFFDLFV